MVMHLKGQINYERFLVPFRCCPRDWKNDYADIRQTNCYSLLVQEAIKLALSSLSLGLIFHQQSSRSQCCSTADLDNPATVSSKNVSHFFIKSY